MARPEASVKTICDRLQPAGRHWPFLLLGLGFLLAYSPFLRCIAFDDYDSMACLGEIQASGRYLGWPGGYFFNSAWVGLTAKAVGLLGGGLHNYLLSYHLIVAFSALGIIGFSYALLYFLTQSRSMAVVMCLLLGLTPGLIQLIAMAEDNVPASFLNMQALAFFIFFIHMHRKAEPIPKRRCLLAGVLYPISLALAVLAHRQLAVDLVFPLFIFYLLRNHPLRTRFRLVAQTYGIVLILMLAVFAIIGYYRNGTLHDTNILLQLHEWFVPNRYYQQFYFYNRWGWDLNRQALAILAGWSQVLGVKAIVWPATALGVLLIAALAAMLKKKRFLDDYALIVLAAVLIHIPHSLVYESENLERWDAIIPPAAVLIGVLLQRVRESGSVAVFGRRINHAWILLPLLAPFGVHHAGFYLRTVSTLEAQQNDPLRMRMRAIRQLKYEMQKVSPKARCVLLLPGSMQNKILMDILFSVFEPDFSYRDSLFFIGNQEIHRSKFFYAFYEKVAPAELARLLRGTTVLAAPEFRPMLEKMNSGANIVFYPGLNAR